MRQRLYVLLALLWGCSVFDPYGWEGVASFQVIAAGDTTEVRRFDDTMIYLVRPGDSVCIRWKAKGSTPTSFLVQEKWQHVFWIQARPMGDWPALTVIVGGPNLGTIPGRSIC